jgi:hypothetical protein
MMFLCKCGATVRARAVPERGETQVILQVVSLEGLEQFRTAKLERLAAAGRSMSRELPPK